MTVVVGTAGHIDHGKTALLRALTGIDADRLPEERRRGMTIDVGYAHLGLPDGSELDFVDVPGHDRLVGNMLVGAGEIDAVLLVVAADDGPRAQTVEHVGLLDGLGLSHGIVAITKADLVLPGRLAEVRAAVEELLAGTRLVGAPIFAVSSLDGRGISSLAAALVELRDRALADPLIAGSAHSRLAIDRVFSVRGRGLVVTGTLRGAPLTRGAMLRLVPGDRSVRARELQVHGRGVDEAGPGRTAVNLTGVDAVDVHRGLVLTDDAAIGATDRMLVRLRTALPDRTPIRVHLGTASTDGWIGRAGRDAIDLAGSGAVATLRLATPVAAGSGDRFVLRRESGADRVVGGVVLDVAPPRGLSRRRQTPDRVRRLSEAIDAGDGVAVVAARLDLHGALGDSGSGVTVAEDIFATVAADIAGALVEAQSGSGDAELALPTVRARVARTLRRLVTLDRSGASVAAIALVDRLIADGRIERDGERLRLPGSRAARPAASDPVLVEAMDRLERALAVPAPPPLADAARDARCPQPGVRELERQGRIVVLDHEIAYAAGTYRSLEALTLELAGRGPLTPAALRDATGTSRRYVMAILADLDRRGILRRTEAGHVPGPRAGSVTSRPEASAAGTPIGEP
jgi:selenocysteine-specific elongation factor